MKKYIAIFAAIVVIGAAGFIVVDQNKRNFSEGDASKSSTSTNSSVSGNDSITSQKTISEAPTQTTTTAPSQKAEEVSFKAQIDGVTGSTLMLVPDKGTNEAKSSDKISVGTKNVDVVDQNGKKIAEDDMMNFTRAQVFYDGLIRETYPAGITAQKIILSGREYCNIYFYSSNKLLKTIRLKVGSNLDSADMPNAGASCPDGYHFEGWMNNGKDINGLENINDSVNIIAKIRKD